MQAFLFGIVALITDVIWGYSGILTFASSAMFGIGAYALGIMFVHVSPTPGSAILAILAAMLAAGLVSAAIGWLAFYSRTRVSEFYLAVVTLGISMLFGQAVLYGGALTGGSNGLSGFATLSLSNRAWYLIAAIALLVSGGLALKILSSDFGLLLRAIRDNELRCRYLGIKTPGVKTAVFSVCNALIAATGVFYGLFTTVVSPSLVGLTLATNVLIWVILGGRATIVGPALAAILITAATPQLSTTIPAVLARSSWPGVRIRGVVPSSGCTASSAGPRSRTRPILVQAIRPYKIRHRIPAAAGRRRPHGPGHPSRFQELWKLQGADGCVLFGATWRAAQHRRTERGRKNLAGSLHFRRGRAFVRVDTRWREFDRT